MLEDPSRHPPEKDLYTMTTAPEAAPAEPEVVSIEFKRGVPIKVRASLNVLEGRALYDLIPGYECVRWYLERRPPRDLLVLE